MRCGGCLIFACRPNEWPSRDLHHRDKVGNTPISDDCSYKRWNRALYANRRKNFALLRETAGAVGQCWGPIAHNTGRTLLERGLAEWKSDAFIREMRNLLHVEPSNTAHLLC